ncbi:hypothetical protein LWE61_07580 [Sphingobium sufflavum]|uniref:hypothetical protein n=1 Tax=Sphingobium sufflavum TaxID=1129547 RepID=UPI001F385B7E|nr:hypothetical protein [Sphingobium sufflavum]MCE7796422.1 hypothetical protein [Sphingobium sufflavum]
MKGILFSTAGLLALAVSAQAQAQAPEQPTAGASDIIVTAQRRAERTQDVPISITAISSEALQQANV